MGIRASIFQGPMPPPEMMERYEVLCPGFTERTLRMVELQADNRRGLEQRVIDAKIQHEGTGQWMAFTLGVMFLLVGAFALYLHEIGVGVGIWSVDIAGIIGMFILRQRREIRGSTSGVPPGGTPQTVPDVATLQDPTQQS